MIGAVCSGFHRAVDVPAATTPDHAVSTTDSWQRTITAGSEEATSTALSKIESNVAPRDFERPNDFEPLEYGKDIVVELESFPTGLPTEIAAMGSHPPVSRPVPFPLIPRERLVDLGQRFDHHFGSTPDEPLTPYSVEHHDEIAGLRHWFATVAVIACQTGSGPLDPGDDQIGQFGRDLRGITE